MKASQTRHVAVVRYFADAGTDIHIQDVRVYVSTHTS